MQIREKLLIAWLAALAMASGARAQDILGPPPDLRELPTVPKSLILPEGDSTSSSLSGQMEDLDIGTVELGPQIGEGALLHDPAEVWTSQTWIDRGYWYAYEEVVVTTREFDRRNVLLTTDTVQFGIAGRNMQIRTRHPGAVANARFTLGRFLFRDTKNRDHLLEATYFGAGEEYQSHSVTSFVPNGLETPFQLSTGNQAFDGSNSQFVTYTHEFNGVELNYRVRSRLDRDHMVLRPNGDWVRQGKSGYQREILTGIRWMSADEWFLWKASGARNGEMRIKTNNDLLGVQIGGGARYAKARWSAGVTGKAGAYINFARVNRDITLFDEVLLGPDTLVEDDRVRAEEEDLSFLGEFAATVRYHVHPNFSVRFGYQLMYLDSIAVAPFQITFTPQFNQVGLSGSSLYQGFLLGIEGYW